MAVYVYVFGYYNYSIYMYYYIYAYILSCKLYSGADMCQKKAKLFTSGRKHQNWYLGVLEHADSEF